MRGQLVGIKHIKGTSAKTGKDFAFSVACISTPMSERDKENGAKGADVHTPTIPDRLVGVLCDANIGKEIEIEFYFANGREGIAYCEIAK